MSKISDEAFNGQEELNCSLEYISPQWLTTNNETKLQNHVMIRGYEEAKFNYYSDYK